MFGQGWTNRPAGDFSSWTGSLDIVLTRSVARASPRLTHRAPPVALLAVGQPPEQAGARLRRLHTLCGRAHEIALWRAIEAARPAGAAREAARELTLWTETTVAHARRVALELEPWAGRAVPAAALRAVQTAGDAALRAIGLEGASGRLAPRPADLPRLLGQLRQAFADLLRQAQDAPPAEPLKLLPEALREPVREGWRAPWRFAEDHRPVPCAAITAEPASDPPTAAGPAEGAARTSRGRLVYGVTVRHGRVTHCQADTPTGRFAAADGPIAAALGRLPWSDGVAACADLVVRALDPCVPWTLRLGQAGDA